MKQLSKIVVLATLIAGIVALWLMPGINKAADADYVRIYEDTDHAEVQPVSFVLNDTTQKKKAPKKYKVEKIGRKERLGKVNAKMYSRIVQFEEVPADSTEVKEIPSEQTAKIHTQKVKKEPVKEEMKNEKILKVAKKN